MDDDFTSLFLAQLTLEEAKIAQTVLVFQQPEKALEYVVEHCADDHTGEDGCPSLVLLDLNMPVMDGLEHTAGFRRVIGLCNCLDIIASGKEYTTLSTEMTRLPSQKGNEKIDKVFDFTINSFKRCIELQEVSDLSNMSIPAFCNYFKKCTKKTYINFLNEVRIGYACRMLTNTDHTINQICFDSGFQSLQNFNKQFYKLKGVTPSAYRKRTMGKEL